MGFFALTATLTNDGKALIDTAKANGQLVKADQISFGDFTGTLSATTTSIGNLLDTAGHITQATNLTFTRAEFQCLFKGRPSDKVGTVGVYSGGILIAVARVTVESIVKGNTQLAIRLDYANASVFAKPNSSIAASLLADIHKKAYDDTAAYLQNGNAVGNKAFFGLANGKESDWFCSFANIMADQSEFNAALAKNPAEGTVAYSLQDNKKYVLISGAWVQQATGGLSDVVKPGRFYRSDLTLSVYYARTSSDLLRVYKLTA